MLLQEATVKQKEAYSAELAAVSRASDLRLEQVLEDAKADAAAAATAASDQLHTQAQASRVRSSRVQYASM